ncbi:MAG: 2-oxoacid:acceptor oxidoreductase subunit alpha, partial [Bradymonadales bacterium]
AEVEPPRRSKAGASGNRVRIGSSVVSNAGDEADLVVAFNEQVLYSRIDVGALKRGTRVFIEEKWAKDPKEQTRAEFAAAMADFEERGYVITPIPMESETLKYVDEPRHGKNIWALGMLCAIYNRDIELAKLEIERRFAKKSKKVISNNHNLLNAGYEWAKKNIDLRFEIPAINDNIEKIVVNGNQAVALGILAAGFELCSIYPITPATSVSHYLASALPKAGGLLHQAEDEIAAIGFAIGASYAGKTAVTITSGPGFALKTEFLGLAVMGELPLVIVDVQRGGPSTGLPTRVEQSDLLSALYAQPGDAPKVILAPSTHEECFHFMVTARKLAETFRTPVIVLTDANLATGQQPIARPKVKESWLSPPIDQSDWDTSVAPYDWDPQTGLSQRPIPGQRYGNYVLTGLAHNRNSRVAYESQSNQDAMAARSLKLTTLQKTLNAPIVYGDEDGGELLVVAWGSTRGATEEAVKRLRERGKSVSCVFLRFLSPLEPGLREIFNKFKRVMTIEINYSDPPSPEFAQSRRYAQLATILRAHTLYDVDCWSRVPGIPLSPKTIELVIEERLASKDSKIGE